MGEGGGAGRGGREGRVGGAGEVRGDPLDKWSMLAGLTKGEKLRSRN